MMRSLWTAASGMTAQMLHVDTISNNLANVNTHGYKGERLEFKSLLYEMLKRADLDPANPPGRPVNLQVGHGVRPSATARNFGTGSLERTDHYLDFAILGEGFFVVDRSILPDGDQALAFTKAGNFKASPSDEGWRLCTPEGFPVLDIDNEPIVIPYEMGNMKNLSAMEDGRLFYVDADGEMQELDQQINLVQFRNVQGLETVGTNLFVATTASGPPLLESEGEVYPTSVLEQGVLEMSNVQVAQEMVNLIVAQRAYELNSKAITTSDSMLETANNLKR